MECMHPRCPLGMRACWRALKGGVVLRPEQAQGLRISYIQLARYWPLPGLAAPPPPPPTTPAVTAGQSGTNQK